MDTACAAHALPAELILVNIWSILPGSAIINATVTFLEETPMAIEAAGIFAQVIADNATLTTVFPVRGRARPSVESGVALAPCPGCKRA